MLTNTTWKWNFTERPKWMNTQITKIDCCQMTYIYTRLCQFTTLNNHQRKKQDFQICHFLSAICVLLSCDSSQYFLIEASFQKSECSAYLSTDCQLSKAASGVEAVCTTIITSTLHSSAVSALTTENHLQQYRTPQTEADDNSQHN